MKSTCHTNIQNIDVCTTCHLNILVDNFYFLMDFYCAGEAPEGIVIQLAKYYCNNDISTVSDHGGCNQQLAACSASKVSTESSM